VIFALKEPMIMKAIPVRIEEYRNWFASIVGANGAKTKDNNGMNPIITKAKKVAKAVFLGFLLL